MVVPRSHLLISDDDQLAGAKRLGPEYNQGAVNIQVQLKTTFTENLMKR
jgi:hypothetical protein